MFKQASFTTNEQLLVTCNTTAKTIMRFVTIATNRFS